MRLWVGVTDRNWFEFLRARQPDEVNFWQPSARRRAAVLDAGAPFLFKPHAPRNFIVGGGFFVRYSALPARLAWEAFGANNGVATDYTAWCLCARSIGPVKPGGDAIPREPHHAVAA